MFKSQWSFQSLGYRTHVLLFKQHVDIIQNFPRKKIPLFHSLSAFFFKPARSLQVYQKPLTNAVRHSHGRPFSSLKRSRQTTTKAIRVDTSTSNYGIACVWFTYIGFSMEKDIVFAHFCLFVHYLLWIFFTKRPEI